MRCAGKRLFAGELFEFGCQGGFAVLADLYGVFADADDHFVADGGVRGQGREGAQQGEMRVAERLDFGQVFFLASYD